ncbi:MAG: hypothetical protein AAB815_01145 [Patescibacteria group bacterium]
MKLDLTEIAVRTGRTPKEVQHLIDVAKKTMIPLGKQVSVVDNELRRFFIVTRQGVGILKTDYGKFYHFDFTVDDVWGKYSVLFFGSVDEDMMPTFQNKEVVLMRIDFGCETSQLFLDKTCECREQLWLAMKTIAEHGEGLIVSIPRQDGRGLGLPFKLATLLLQDQLRLNTVEAAHAIAPNGVIDIRTYSGVVGILKYLEIPTTARINLATNNPHKAEIFSANGYTIDDYTPIVIEPTDATRVHLEAKQAHLGHIGLIQPEVAL